MQLFPCPFCGNRPETEFTYCAEPRERPEPASEVSNERWAAYLFENRNPKGATREIWLHQTCGEFFALDRDTVTHAVKGSQSLRKERP